MGAELLHSSRHTRRAPSRKSSRNLRRRHAPICTSPPIREFYAGSAFASSAPAPSELPMPRLIYPDRIGYRIGLPATHLVVVAFGKLKQEKELKALGRDFQERAEEGDYGDLGRKRAAGLRNFYLVR
ncbi:hypothetical protein KFK09_006136 [Dendrobium nobile]|uniref:Uncharacterized protein n=1 Tax=Dendrobium nobile TaxID=94219 RepID=A0A8T3BQH3_DENNO|nr:hypothetical protein KFK09_006136 [Dendrobium nobile]